MVNELRPNFGLIYLFVFLNISPRHFCHINGLGSKILVDIVPYHMAESMYQNMPIWLNSFNLKTVK